MSSAPVDPLKIAADGAVGFLFMKVIFEAVEALSITSPELARQLAGVGVHLADGLSDEMSTAQDSIERGES